MHVRAIVDHYDFQWMRSSVNISLSLLSILILTSLPLKAQLSRNCSTLVDTVDLGEVADCPHGTMQDIGVTDSDIHCTLFKPVVDPEHGDSDCEDSTELSGTVDLPIRLGPLGAPVEIVEFSDFECPYCAIASKIIKGVLQRYPHEVRYVLKHYPLSDYRIAGLAHQATQAAGAQGKFWEMRDLLFANQRKLGWEELLGYAQQLDLDLDRFIADLDSGKHQEVVLRDRAEGERLGVKGTPTFFINGRRLVGVQPYSVFKKVIEDELRRLKIRALDPVEDRSEGAAIVGPAEASTTLAVFSDFESPLSAKAAAMAHALRSMYPDDVRVLFKSFPLEFHEDAKLAHEAALAAGDQGKFWEMHDLLFQNQRSLGRERLMLYAGRLGLDLSRFEEALDSRRYQEVVRQDMLDGVNRDVRGVPTFFVAGRRLDGLPSLEDLNAVVAEELASRVSQKPEAASTGGLPTE